MRRVVIVSLLVLSVAAIGAAQSVADVSTARLTNGELASLILQIGQPGATPLQSEVAMQQVQRLGFMPTHWRSGSMVTEASFSQTVERLGLDYGVELPQSLVSPSAARTYLVGREDQVQATLARQTDAAMRPHNVLSDRRPVLTSSADFN